jgi:predicted DsbA family dithiol-disulfide isomerase
VKIQVVQDLICPWCYIGHHNLDVALKEWTAAHAEPVEIEWLPYQLDPLEDGAPQEDFRERFITRKGVGPEQMDQMFDRVTQVGASLGIPFRFDKVTVAVDTLPGHIAIAAAPAAKQSALVSAFHKAYFEEGRDIGNTEEVLVIATAAGLNDEEIQGVRNAIADPTSRQAVRDLIGEVQGAGITSVPYFVIDSKLGLSGGQPPEVFTQAFEQAATAVVS